MQKEVMTKAVVMEMLNNDERCKGLLQELNQQCIDHGVSPDSKEYKVLRELLVLRIIKHHEGIKEAMAQSIYSELKENKKQEERS